MDQLSTILIVDDDTTARATLRALLSRGPYKLVTASSGQEALEQAALHTPDLILLDVMMPGMDGFAVCRALRADPTHAEVPVIMTTALDDRESRVQGIAAGADDFLPKPIDFVELDVRVRSITRLNRYRRLLDERTRRQQAQLEAAIAAETARHKDQFITNVSHELRTPLAVLTLLSGNLDALYDQLDDGKRHAMVRRMRQQVAVLNQLVGGVLEVARADSGQIEQERGRLNLARLAADEVQSHMPLAESRGQAVHVAGQSELAVCGNAGQVRRIVSNLLSNAMKYTPQGGRISVVCAATPVPGADVAGWPGSQALAGGWAAVRVSDTGVGIDAQDLPHIFERFFRAAPQGAVPGAGLGLAIAQELARSHGGAIAVGSQPGDGTTFVLYMPLLEGTAP